MKTALPELLTRDQRASTVHHKPMPPNRDTILCHCELPQLLCHHRAHITQLLCCLLPACEKLLKAIKHNSQECSSAVECQKLNTDSTEMSCFRYYQLCTKKSEERQSKEVIKDDAIICENIQLLFSNANAYFVFFFCSPTFNRYQLHTPDIKRNKQLSKAPAYVLYSFNKYYTPDIPEQRCEQ